MGDAVTTTLLLSDWERYGLSERVSYHFDLTETLVASSSSSSSPHFVQSSTAQSASSATSPDRNNRQNNATVKGQQQKDEQGSSNDQQQQQHHRSSSVTTNVSGVVGMLECVPFAPLAKLTRRQRRALRNDSRDFNLLCARVREDARVDRDDDNDNNNAQQRQQESTGDDDTDENHRQHTIRNAESSAYYCHEPRRLPLKLNPASRLFFAYEVTRIAFCLDASPTLTSTFGMSSGNGGGQNDSSMYDDGSCCPMDRVGSMARMFFQALCSEPIDAPSMIPATTTTTTTNSSTTSNTTMQRVWRPELQVSVIAVFPRGTGLPQTQLLVRDFRVTDRESATLLAKRIEEWALNEVESEIARRLSQQNNNSQNMYQQPEDGDNSMNGWNNNNNLLDGYDAWSIKLHSSSLRDILDAGDVSLSILSSAAKPCIVVATDGRSISCDGVMDILADADRSDTPLVVLDLSNPNSHSQYHHKNNSNTTTPSAGGAGQHFGEETSTGRYDQLSLISHDPGGPSSFPLHLSDDTEALHGICRATGGCFFDAELLEQAASTKAGQQEDSPFHVDHYFSFKRRSLKPNAVQWYILFSLSPLSPTFSSAWGKIVPPRYLRQRTQGNNNNNMANANPNNANNANGEAISERRSLGWAGSRTNSRASSSIVDISMSRQSPTSDLRRLEVVAQRKQQVSRTTFSTYVVNPIRIKGLLMMRVKEGYRARQYGQSTQDTDRVLIQFNLPLELGTVLHYELSYKALPNQSHMVGVAHIKIELSGESGFIQSVKHDFLRQTPAKRPDTMAQNISARLCKILRWIRMEDCLQSYLCPLRWSDQLSSPQTPFVRRLRTLTGLQRRKHFRFDQFDVVCTGSMPYALDDGFLSEFQDLDDGEQELLDAMAEWSSQTITEGCRYVRQTDRSGSLLANYCVVELSKSTTTSRVFTVSVECFGGTGASARLEILSSLRHRLSMLKDVEVLSKQMADYVVGVRKHKLDQYAFWRRSLLENQHHHASWDLVKDPELLPLIMKRRTEIGAFILLESCDDHALFAKLVPSIRDTTDDLIQYQIAILADRVVIDLHMESTCGDFSPFRPIEQRGNQPIPQFYKYVQSLRKRDQECGRALRCRTALLKLFNEGERDDAEVSEDETELACVRRLLPYANKVVRKLRFFGQGAGSTNDILMSLSEQALLYNSFGVRVARLSIDPGETIHEMRLGAWFIAEFDRHTIGIIHYSLLDLDEEMAEKEEKDEKIFTCRHLTIFTVCISDLYSLRDDTADDDSVDSHISEFIQTTEFAENLEVAHSKMYAIAPYLALKEGPLPVEKFQMNDLDMVLTMCEFVEVASVLVGGTTVTETSVAPGAESKLQELLFTILGQVNGCSDNNNNALFYYKIPDEEDAIYKLGESETDSISEYNSLDGDTDLDEDDDNSDRFLDSDPSTNLEFASRSDDHGDVVGPDGAATTPEISASVFPPVFVRFMLDGEPASLADLSAISKSSILAIHLSLFRDDSRRSRSRFSGQTTELPGIHGRVALEIAALLNAYVAEQTLERLRHFGQALTQDDLKMVKSCLRGARNVLTSKVEVFFYSGKMDTMVPATAPAGGEGAIVQGFNLLQEELLKSDSFSLQSFPGDVFVAMETSNNSETTLDFWCLLNIRRTHISVKVYHPQGAEMAFAVLTKVQDMISHCCHRVNQQLLLKRLHQSRTASELLIPKDVTINGEPETDLESLFRPGVFSCPTVFQTSFELFHRCATNPAQVAMKLEATVLHSFAVSNRRNRFVYKDETGDVFYMMLESQGGGVEPDGTIDLVVFGIQEPGPSITIQLTQLLQRRLLSIAVDMLSSVLTKNPHFHWKQNDLNFIRYFEDEWRKLDDAQDAEPKEQIIDYEFPVGVTPAHLDPGMILLYFRQNLCGSTFYHRLNIFAGEVKYDSNELPSVEEDIAFNPNDFTFYYNNSPSKLDPKFQSVSTLTEKGEGYCRQAGAGIAIITVSLVHSGGDPVESIRFGKPVLDRESVPDVPIELLRMKRVDDSTGQKDAYVRVSITSTVSNSEALHNWVLLTLNQVFIAWWSERHLERMERNLIHNSPRKPTASNDCEKSQQIDMLCPGLPYLTSLIDKSFALPHPAFGKHEFNGVIRASTVASVTMDLLESIAALSTAEARKGISPADILVIRLSRSEMPRRVGLSRIPSTRETNAKLILNGEEGTSVRDKPIDCPEYICFFSHPQSISSSSDGNKNLPMMFKEVVVDDGNSDKSLSIARLEKLKESEPHLFFRSFAFILSVKRNRRIFLTYNWNPQVVKKVASKMSEMDQVFLKSASQSMESLQVRTLKMLSPPTEGLARNIPVRVPSRNRKREIARTDSQVQSIEATAQGDLPNRGPKPRISRPTSIRRPKLVGKSVEGAAMHAVAASRARASNKQRFGRGGAPVGASQPQKGQRDGDSGAPKRGSGNEKKETRLVQVPKKLSRPADKALVSVRTRFDSLLSGSMPSVRGHSLRQWAVMKSLLTPWWPANEKSTIPRSVVDFFVRNSPRIWQDVREIPPVPPKLLSSLVLTLAHTIRLWNPGTIFMPVPSQEIGRTNSVFLMTEVKSVRSCKCVAIFKVGISKFGGKGRKKMILRNQGWIVVLPRHQQTGQRKERSMSLALSEKDSAAFDRLATDTHASLNLDCRIFDVFGFVIERVVKSLDSRLMYDEIIPTIRTLLVRYPLEYQERMTKLNYRVFDVTIVLASYENRLINFYDAPTHYAWFLERAVDRDLIICGNDGLCFKKEIVLPNAVNAICFLTSDTADPAKFKLLLVSRTQGRHLHEFMFWNGSNTAMSILNNLAVEAADIVYEELRASAKDLRRNDLWTKASKIHTRKSEKPTMEDVEELLVLIPPEPLLERLSSLDKENVATVMDSDINWLSCCDSMTREPSFSPSHVFSSTSNQTKLYLYYIRDDDLFLLFHLNLQGELLSLRMLSKEDKAVKDERAPHVIQKVMNYLLHYLWFSI